MLGQAAQGLLAPLDGPKLPDDEVAVLWRLEDQTHRELCLLAQRVQRPSRAEARTGTTLAAAPVGVDEAFRLDHLFEPRHVRILHPVGPDHGVPPDPARLDRNLV